MGPQSEGMNRREFLHRAGASTAVAGLAGCLGSATPNGSSQGDSSGGDSSDDNSPDDGCATPEKSSADDFSGVESEAATPFREISLGSRDAVAFPKNNRPRTLRVWNAAAETRTIDLRIARGADRLFDEAVEFAPDAYLTVTLAEPADYSVSVGVSGDSGDSGNESCDSGTSTSAGTSGDAGATAEATAFPVPRSAFDCNTATIDVGVMPDGRIETLEAATTMGCPSPSVAETAFSAEQGNCGTEDSASVTFDRERVSVEGAVRTPTPQWTLELAAAEYDADANRLAVRVRATKSETAGPGVQCVAEVPYEATVGFESGLPSEVVVVHEANGEAVEVARASR